MRALLAGDVAEGDQSGLPIASQLAAAEARVQGLEEIVAILRERLGMADAHNLELNRRLEESHATVDRVLPLLCRRPARLLGRGDRRGASGSGE